VAVASAGPYASLHLAPDNHTSTPLLSFLQAGCPSCRPTNSVKAVNAVAESVSEKKIKSVNIWKSYKQEHGCLMHFVRLATTPLKVHETTTLLLVTLANIHTTL